jgi:hypothetical protein
MLDRLLPGQHLTTSRKQDSKKDASRISGLFEALLMNRVIFVEYSSAMNFAACR